MVFRKIITLLMIFICSTSFSSLAWSSENYDDCIFKNMKDIAIYGAGGFGKEVACIVNLLNEKKSQWKRFPLCVLQRT